MPHALIIEDNMIVSRVIEEQLSHAGFNSCDHAWTERQALELANHHIPDLIVIGDAIEQGSAIEAARQICGNGPVPVVLATANASRARRRLPKGASMCGPYSIGQIGKALDDIKRADSHALPMTMFA